MLALEYQRLHENKALHTFLFSQIGASNHCSGYTTRIISVLIERVISIWMIVDIIIRQCYFNLRI